MGKNLEFLPGLSPNISDFLGDISPMCANTPNLWPIIYSKVSDLMVLTEVEIRTYLQYLVQKGLSDSYINQSINAINHSMTDFTMK